MDSGLNLVEHLLLGKLLEIRNLQFLHVLLFQQPAKLGGQIKLINFIPESIVPNIVECFLDI